MLYPFVFQPIFKERIWGGRMLEKHFNKPLPPLVPIGESWEISDRPGNESLIANGPLTGKSLRWLMQEHGPALLGPQARKDTRFPLLVKVLDARERLSVQVHPPAAEAARLGGEPKTEMWYIAHAEPHAELFVGLKRSVTREIFVEKIKDGTVADCLHRVPVQAGDAIFLPSGRVHAIGAGLVIFEIQQNSDTTYRVFDWNRTGPDGKTRELHVAESLASIQFDDFEPELIRSQYSRNPVMKLRYLVDHPLFRVDAYQVKRGQRFYLQLEVTQTIGMIRGRLEISYEGKPQQFRAGQFVMLPASLQRVALTAETQVEYLQIQAGSSSPA